MSRRLIFLLAVFAAGCTLDSETPGRSAYFNIDSLVREQVKMLGGLEVRKEVHLDGEIEEERMVLDTADWYNELRLFSESSINSPANAGGYVVEKQLDDPESNLLFDRYSAKESHRGQVRVIEIYYYVSPDQIKKVRVRQEEENELYNSSKELFLSFTTVDQRSFLSEYSIEGYQKLITRDSTSFLIRGKVQMN